MKPARDVVAELHQRIEDATAPREAVPWFMDIDGVLNVIGKVPLGGWGRYERKAVMTSEGYVFPVVWAPDLVTALNRLVERQIIAIRWLTTWESDAHTHFAPQVGLRVGSRLAGIDHNRRDEQGFKKIDPTWWKLRIIREHLQTGDALFVWSDDEIMDDLEAQQEMDLLPAGRAVVLTCEPHRGITPAHVHQVLDAIEASTSG